MRSSQGMSAGELLRQANQLKRSGKLDEAILVPRPYAIAHGITLTI
ncbi:hypothetical protein [Limnospira platensis]